MKCENCNKDHNGSYGSGRFCTSKCARSFSTKHNREEINKKTSISMKKWVENNKEIYSLNNKKSIEYMKIGFAKWKKIQEDKLFIDDFCSMSYERQRKRIILEQNNKCNRCENDTWQGKIIPLEIDHIDGNNRNNIRNNMEALCPNCHALTPTWRGKNKRQKNKITDQQIIDILLECGNIHQCLLKIGLAAKGNNYIRIKKMLTRMGLNYNDFISYSSNNMLDSD